MPFNLEDFKNGRDAVTRDGRVAKFIAYRPELAFHSRVIGSVDLGICSWTETGCSHCKTIEDTHDLVSMAPVKHTGWINIYKPTSSTSCYCALIYENETWAKRETMTECVATIQISWEEK